MTAVYICDYIRTPIGRFGGSLSQVRSDDLAAIPLRALIARDPGGASALGQGIAIALERP